jgi:hypothetical protein
MWISVVLILKKTQTRNRKRLKRKGIVFRDEKTYNKKKTTEIRQKNNKKKLLFP